ncbi:MAG: alpha-L-arabinofuranosidase [Gammaproteobacteria bacterium]|nr:MAG: alpha-L-arabinofuranosidase [Gammaproteobacteria bacterium]
MMKTLTLLAGALLGVTALASPLRIDVDARHDGPVLSRYLYGHFSEHLGDGLYNGLWVGPDSDIPTVGDGFRRDVVEALRELGVPVLRWPGGCFADEYHWRDGIGPRAKRPVRTNTHWGWVPEPNAVGTHEYFQLLELLGAEAYVAGNLGSGSVAEMADWLTYLTADGDHVLARERRANGRERPWKVAFWGVGNESWGCGGHLRPEHYADLYRRYATFLKAPPELAPLRIASGGYDALTEWTEVLARDVPKNLIDGISHHYYTLPTGDWAHKGASTGFPEREWIGTLARALALDEHIAAQVRVLERHDPENRIGLYLDEWGTWYDGDDPARPLYQRNTLRDALVAALHFHVFHRHAERVRMANIAQMVNVLQALILTDGPRMVRTPTYYAFWLHRPFRDARRLESRLRGVPRYRHGDLSVPAVDASAARAADGRILLSLVNLDPNRPQTLSVGLDGATAADHEAEVLTAEAMDAENRFDAPSAVKPRPLAVVQDGDRLRLTLPPKSVAVLRIRPSP